MTLQTILAALIAIGIPAAFLALIYTLDFYASRTFKSVLLCVLWGAVGAFLLSYVLNTYVGLPLAGLFSPNSYAILVVAIAPVVEEVAKSLSLLSLLRMGRITYFVDGAIYGFAAGIGFSIIENFLYMSQNPGKGIGLALTRAFSTCLMHGTAAGLVGVGVGRFRFQHGSGRRLVLIGGWIAAIILHVLFNWSAHAAPFSEGVVLPLAVGIGLAGVGLIAFFIITGLREEKHWLAETLNRQVGVTTAERRAAQAYGDLEEILKPIAEMFPRKAEQVQELLLKQAQMGIKLKVRQQVDDPRLREQLEQEIAQLKGEMEGLRKDVGLCVMTYVRSVFPEGALDIWGKMEMMAACSGPPDIQRWAAMLTRPDKGEPPRQGIFSRLQEAGEK